MATDNTQNEFDNIDAETLIEAFGGIRPMAQKLDIAVSTVQGWKSRNHIPPARMAEILDVAKGEGIDVASLSAPEIIDGEAIILDDKSDEKRSEHMEKPISQGPVEPIPDAAPRGGSSIAWLALIVAVGVGGAVLTRPVWAPIVAPKLAPLMEKYAPAVDPQVDSVSDVQLSAALSRIAALEDALAKQVNAPKPIVSVDSVIDGAFDALDNRLIDIEVELETLDAEMERTLTHVKNLTPGEIGGEAAYQNADEILSQISKLSASQMELRDQLDTKPAGDPIVIAEVNAAMALLKQTATVLEDKIAALDEKISRAASKPAYAPGQQAAALVVSVSQLEGDALAGLPYSANLSGLTALAQSSEALLSNIEPLVPYADFGVSTRTELNRQFAALAPEADTAYRVANATDWMDETVENIRGLVSIRRIGDDPDLPPVSRAEAALERGDLAAAIEAVNEISDSDAVVSWMINAQERLAVEQALTDLRSNAIALLVEANTGASQ